MEVTWLDPLKRSFQVNNPSLSHWEEPGGHVVVVVVVSILWYLYLGVSLNGGTPKHPKMIIFSRKIHGCWVPACQETTIWCLFLNDLLHWQRWPLSLTSRSFWVDRFFERTLVVCWDMDVSSRSRCCFSLNELYNVIPGSSKGCCRDGKGCLYTIP